MGIHLITGAAGYLGTYLRKALRERGQEVRGFDLRAPAACEDGVQWVTGDIRDPAAVRRACDGAEVVYHLAALIPQRRATPEVMRAVNVDGTAHVLEAARAVGVRRVVYLSSVEVYGVPAVSPCPEEAPLAPIGEYGRNKVESEGLCLEAVRQGLEVSILRPTTIVGPGLDEPFFLGLLRSVRDGKPVVILGRGANRFQLVHGEDVAAVCMVAAEHPAAVGEAFNVGSVDVPSIGRMVEEVLARVGSRSRIVRLPAGLARVAVGALRLVGRAPLEPEHMRIALSEYVFSVAKAERVLGWHPRWPQVEAMIETYAWLTGKGGSEPR